MTADRASNTSAYRSDTCTDELPEYQERSSRFIGSGPPPCAPWRLPGKGARGTGESCLRVDAETVQDLDVPGFEPVEGQPYEVGWVVHRTFGSSTPRLSAKSISVWVPVSPGTSAATRVPWPASSHRTPLVRPPSAVLGAECA